MGSGKGMFYSELNQSYKKPFTKYNYEQDILKPILLILIDFILERYYILNKIEN